MLSLCQLKVSFLFLQPRPIFITALPVPPLWAELNPMHPISEMRRSASPRRNRSPSSPHPNPHPHHPSIWFSHPSSQDEMLVSNIATEITFKPFHLSLQKRNRKKIGGKATNDLRGIEKVSWSFMRKRFPTKNPAHQGTENQSELLNSLSLSPHTHTRTLSVLFCFVFETCLNFSRSSFSLAFFATVWNA